MHVHTHDAGFHCSYHVPEEVGDPVDGRVDAADKLQVFAVGHPLLDQEQHKAGWHEGHGKDHTDRHDHIHSAVVTVRNTHKQSSFSTNNNDTGSDADEEKQLSKILRQADSQRLHIVCQPGS